MRVPQMHLHLQRHAVVGQGDVLGEPGVGYAVESCGVRHVDEMGMGGTETTGEGYGFLQRLVGVVGTMAQGTHDKVTQSPKVGYGRFGQGFEVGEIGKPTDTEAKDGQLAVVDKYGEDLGVLDHEGLERLYLVELQRRGRGVFVAEAVVHVGTYVLASTGIGIDVDRAKLAEGTHVVKSTDVVVMVMREQDAVQGQEGLVEHLLTEVGATVYEYPRAVSIDKGTAAQTAVTRVGRTAYLAMTPHDRDSATRSSTKEFHSHHTNRTSWSSSTPNFRRTVSRTCP